MPEALYAPLPKSEGAFETTDDGRWVEAPAGADQARLTHLYSDDQMRAYADATCSLRGGQQGWQSIDSAPRDGSEVWSFNGEQGRMHWTEGRVDDIDQWALWVWADPALAELDPSPDQPTHWMPLPSPPPSTHPQETQP